MSTEQKTLAPETFEFAEAAYRHIRLEFDGPVARLILDVQPTHTFAPGYELKLNSYDLGVDLELADAVSRLRFEHPEVSVVIITSGNESVFCAGANIFMLGKSEHHFKVNFCKFTNETRLYIEDATQNSGQTYIAALNGLASGGGYELALACKEIYLIDDRRAAVSLPEVPLLGVLPGTGGLTRLVDKRKVRRDRADVFSTLGEGFKGKRAKAWGLIDDYFAASQFNERIDARAREIAGKGHPERKGITLTPLNPSVSDAAIGYRHVTLTFGSVARTATLEIVVPAESSELDGDPHGHGGDWLPFRIFREFDDALLRLRHHYPEIGTILIRVRGSAQTCRKIDERLEAEKSHWFVHEVRHFIKRVLKRMDVTARTFYALVDEGSCFHGTFLELALAADRGYALDGKGVTLSVNAMNAGPYPMGNGLTRLQTRLLGEPDAIAGILTTGEFSGPEAAAAGLVTDAFDEIDWEDEIRLAIEERASLSPDSLTGLEANLRFAGPETMETKIFGRLSAWQNWIFQRPNAVGERGALKLYGQPESAKFDWKRT